MMYSKSISSFNMNAAMMRVCGLRVHVCINNVQAPAPENVNSNNKLTFETFFLNHTIGSVPDGVSKEKRGWRGSTAILTAHRQFQLLLFTQSYNTLKKATATVLIVV